MNLQLILSLIFEHYPGWIIDGSRKTWIFYAIETKDLEFSANFNSNRCSVYSNVRVC